MKSHTDTGGRYVKDLPYRSDFVPAQAPILLSYVAAVAGYRPPHPGTPFRYLELGCGSGVTLNGLAAACPHGEFIGVDCNVQNVAAARHMANSAGLTNVTYIEALFSQIDPGAIAPVDYIACVGTYSWLDREEKSALLRILDHCLKDGGLFYLGFISLGRAAVTPMWQVLRSLVPADDKGSMVRVKAGIQLLGELRDHGARYLQQNQQALALLNDVHAQYVADDSRALTNLSHNLLADGFRAELLDDVVADLAPIGLKFCAGAVPFSNDPDLCVPAGLRSRYEQLPTRVAQELFKDFMSATVVRTDVFIKGVSRDDDGAQGYVRDVVRVALVGDRDETWRQLERPSWTAFDFSTPSIQYVYRRITSGATSIAQIGAGASFGPDEVRDAFLKLVACPGIELCLDSSQLKTQRAPARVRPASVYNRLALDAALAGAQTVHLAAPGLGSCIPLSPPGSLLIAEFCESGLAVHVDELHARLERVISTMSGISQSTLSPLTNRQSFAQLYHGIKQRAIPLLLRFGALLAD